jgi:hypothetical protein
MVYAKATEKTSKGWSDEREATMKWQLRQNNNCKTLPVWLLLYNIVIIERGNSGDGAQPKDLDIQEGNSEGPY